MSSSSPSLRALVVGGTSGIGHGIALALAKLGHNVMIAGRSAARGEQIVCELEEQSTAATHSFHPVNAFDLQSVRQLAQHASKDDSSIDLLVMTQGMATIQGYTPTINQLDQKLQLHYFSRIYLAQLLAPTMPVGSRILTVLSGGVHSKYSKYKVDFELKDNYSVRNAADAAGYYSDAGFEQLAKRYPQILVCHAAPGFVNTNWGTEFPWYLRGMVRGLQPFGRSLEKCGSILTNGLLNLPLPADQTNDNDEYPVINFHLMDANGKPIKDGMKHSKEEGEEIWEKTLAVLPKN